jgi:hypothetical protein
MGQKGQKKKKKNIKGGNLKKKLQRGKTKLAYFAGGKSLFVQIYKIL